MGLYIFPIIIPTSSTVAPEKPFGPADKRQVVSSSALSLM